MFQRLKKYFGQPYPFLPNLFRRWITVIAFGVFVILFIELFGLLKREGIHNVYILLGFGFITSLSMSINWIILPFFLRRIFNEERWTVMKEILFHVWNLFMIGFLNLVYANIGGYYPINLATFVRAEFGTLIVGIFPVTFIVLLKQNRLLKKYAKGAAELNQTLSSKGSAPDEKAINVPISLCSENGKDRIEVRPGNLLLLRAVDNYVEVYWHDSETIRKALLRNSLKRIEEELEAHEALFRCHRTYLVNTKKIAKVTGNSQGYKLILKGFDSPVPVSRSLSKILREKVA